MVSMDELTLLWFLWNQFDGNNISGASYSYDQDTDLRTISITGSSGDELIIGHMRHFQTLQMEMLDNSSISNRPSNLTIAQQGSQITTLHQMRLVRLHTAVKAMDSTTHCV